MACSKEALRIVLWMCWVSQWLLSSIYVALTLTAFTQLWEASAVYLVQQGSNIYTDKSWRAPMATCILSSLLVIGYDIMSCVTLVKKSINRAGPGFGYGFIVAFCFCLSMFLLLSGLVFDSFRPKVKSLADYDWTLNGTVNGTGFTWQTYDSQTFIGAEVFALINFCTLLIFAVIMVILQNGVSEQLGGSKTTKYSALDAPHVAVPPALDGGYTDAYGQQGYTEEQYGYGEENQALRANEYQTQPSSSHVGNATAYYNSAAPTDYQGYGAVGAAAPVATMNTYGHAGYGQAAYTYNSSQDQEYVPPQPTGGSGLLGGQAIGTTPASGLPPPPPYHNYQQQL